MDKLELSWDTDTAAAVLALGAFLFLVAIRAGFKPLAS